MDKKLTVPKWVLIVRPKIPQMPQKISAHNVSPSPKVRDLKKGSLCVSVVCGSDDTMMISTRCIVGQLEKKNLEKTLIQMPTSIL